MKKALCLLTMIALITAPVWAEEPAPEVEVQPESQSAEALPPMYNFPSEMINLKMPSQGKPGDVVMVMNHRFRGLLNEDPMNGANVLLGIKYMVKPKLELEFLYTSYQNEYNLGMGYQLFKTNAVQSQFNLNYFDYKDTVLPKRSSNAFYLLSLQTKPILAKFIPVINAGYDGYNKRLGWGLGLKTEFATGAEIVERIGIMGEFYPILNPESGVTMPKKTFCVGVNLGTFSHNILLTIGNNTEIGTRRLMLGTTSKDLHFGFNLNRKF